MEMDRYHEGQGWTFRARSHEEGAALVIGRIEERDSTRVFHVQLVGVSVRNKAMGTPQTELGHVPVTLATLDASVLLPASVEFDAETFERGHKVWRETEDAGAFSIPLVEILDYVERLVG